MSRAGLIALLLCLSCAGAIPDPGAVPDLATVAAEQKNARAAVCKMARTYRAYDPKDETAARVVEACETAAGVEEILAAGAGELCAVSEALAE